MIVAIEGIDGSGKWTQSQKLSAHMSAKGIDNSLYTFPNYKETIFGAEITKYLEGGFGNFDMLPPQFPALLYAMDRFEMKSNITQDISCGLNVIFDRYVYSNIAHQAVKLPVDQQGTFIDWIKNLEFNILKMPIPDVVIFLDVEPEIANKMTILRGKQGNTTHEKDIHETNRDYMVKVYNLYKKIAIEEDWIIIKSTDGKNLLDENIIAKDVIISLAHKGYPVEEPKLF